MSESATSIAAVGSAFVLIILVGFIRFDGQFFGVRERIRAHRT